jgi:hypothetical protein
MTTVKNALKLLRGEDSGTAGEALRALFDPEDFDDGLDSDDPAPADDDFDPDDFEDWDRIDPESDDGDLEDPGDDEDDDEDDCQDTVMEYARALGVPLIVHRADQDVCPDCGGACIYDADPTEDAMQSRTLEMRIARIQRLTDGTGLEYRSG